MRGVVLSLEPKKDAVIIAGPNDDRYLLYRSEWRSANEPAVGMEVDFTPLGGVCAKEAFGYFAKDRSDVAKQAAKSPTRADDAQIERPVEGAAVKNQIANASTTATVAPSASIPITIATEWFYAKGDARSGPVSELALIEKIKSGDLSRETKLWREGLPKWILLESTDFRQFLQKPGPPPLDQVDLVHSINERKPAPVKMPAPDGLEANHVAGNEFNVRGGAMPSGSRIKRPLVLLALLILTLFGSVFYFVTDHIKEAKWQREAPQREAEHQEWILQFLRKEGHNAGMKVAQAGLVTGVVEARTMSEIRQLAQGLWAGRTDNKVQEMCGLSGSFYRVGDYESQPDQEAFVSEFTEGYIEAIREYSRRNRPLFK